MIAEIKILYDLLVSFLGEPRRELDGHNYELEFPCPRCIEEKGSNEQTKYNLAVNLKKQKFQCWSCSQVHEDMKGSIVKLIKMYGNSRILAEYKRAIQNLRESELYKLNFDLEDFNISTQVAEKQELEIPGGYHPFRQGRSNPKAALSYLFSRGIGWDIINEFNLGYIEENEIKKLQDRIIIPSYDKFGYLNYWTGRYYGRRKKAQKYYNPQTERKNIVFNEEKIQWDADITLVEGPFDHLVVPNSIPLLGKVLNESFRLYWDLLIKARANVNIFLDGDAENAAISVYKVLNHDALSDRVRLVPAMEGLDPSEIYQRYGYKGIAHCLSKSRKLSPLELLTN